MNTLIQAMLRIRVLSLLFHGFLAAVGGLLLLGLVWTPLLAQTKPVTTTIYLPLTSGQQVVYLPVVKGSDPQPVRKKIMPVYGLVGRIERMSNRSYEFSLSTPNGKAYALLGVTPAIETKLGESVTTALQSVVKVWGTLYQADTPQQPSYIVVTDVVFSGQPAATTPAPKATAPATLPTAIGKFDQVNLRSGPGQSYARSGFIAQGETCPITGRNSAATWIQLTCANGMLGWIEPRFVTVQGTVGAAPSVQPVLTPTITSAALPAPAQPTPVPYNFRGWRTLFYGNTQLAGVPLAVDDLPAIDFNWRNAAPRAGVPADYFSVSFDRTMEFAAGFYLFTIEADDGVRVMLDNQVFVDQWTGMAGQVLRIGRTLSGQHDLRVEYNDQGGAARVVVNIQQATQPLRWDAAYFVTPGASSGTLIAQNEPDSTVYRLDYNWGAGGPWGAPADNWSARWIGQFRFDAGNYTFYAQAEDGLRLSIDGLLVLNKWGDGYGEVRNRFVGIGAGEHTINVEYFDRLGNAQLRVWWVKETTTSSPQ